MTVIERCRISYRCAADAIEIEVPSDFAAS